MKTCIKCGVEKDLSEFSKRSGAIGGKVRGLLCHKCNLMLGLCKDNVTLLNNAIKYLEHGTI